MNVNVTPPVTCASILVCVGLDNMLEPTGGRRVAPQLQPTVYWPETPPPRHD